MAFRLRITGGKPITAEIATDLRQVVFGNSSAPPRGEWTRTPIQFDRVNKDYPFGLKSPRNATRGLQSVIQAFIIKHFLFDKRIREDNISVEQLLNISETQQNEVLWTTMAEILWLIGEKTRVVAVVPGEAAHVPHSTTYFQDSVTEKLFLFEFQKLDDIQIFFKRNLYYFTEDNSPGALLFLYSAVLSRTITKLRADLDGPKGAYLTGNLEEGSLNIITLLLTGRGTPYLHNGVVYVGDEDHYALPQFGILARSTIGFLIYEGDNIKAAMSTQIPESRLKTPALPIWVTSCVGHYGVLFNGNRELLRNYHAEKRFELYYYTCSGIHINMTIDNQFQEDPNVLMLIRKRTSTSSSPTHDEISASPLESLVFTKWQEAKIKFNGTQPSALNY